MRSPRVLLVNPPKTRRKGSGYISKVVDIGIPIGLLQIASVLEEHGVTVEILDIVGDPKATTHHTQDEKTGESIIRYGISKEELTQRVKTFKPDIVGISAQFVGQYTELLWSSTTIKETLPNVPIVIGGSFVTQEVLNMLEKEPTVDLIAFGEGEYTMIDLTKAIQGTMHYKDIKGIAWKDQKGKAHCNEKRQFIFDLDKLPLPAYHLINMEHYLTLPQRGFFNRQKDTKRSITFTTSRGCPENCCFCSVPVVSGKVWRRFPVNYVLDHMELLVKTYNVEKFHIEDDNFTFDMNRAKKIIEGMIGRKFNIEWDTFNGVRADRLDEELIRTFKQSGCVRLCISPEVGNQEVLDKIIDKRMNLNDVIKVAQLCKEINLPLQAYFIIGFPGETKKTLQDTVDFAKMLMRDYDVIVAGAMRATPFYGTRLYKMALEQKALKEPNPDDLDQSLSGGEVLIQTPEFGPEDLDKISKHLVRWGCVYSIKRYLKHPLAMMKRFRNPYLVYSTLRRFVKGTHITA